MCAKIGKQLISLFLLAMAVICSDNSLAAIPAVSTLATISEGANTPLKIAADNAGNLYVTDPRGGGVLKYNSSLQLIQIISTARKPLGIATTDTGNLLVGQGDFVSILNSAGTEIAKLGNGAGQFILANGITVVPSGNIYVVDSIDNCVQIFKSDGSYQGRFGSKGLQAGQFSMPAGITYEKEANQLAVADTLNGRVQFFDLNGAFIKSIGSLGTSPGKFTSPQSVAFEYDKATNSKLARMYVTDSFQSTLHLIDPADTGTFITYVGSYGQNSGQLTNPSDAVFDRTADRLIVVNSLAGNLIAYNVEPAVVVTPPATPLTFTVDALPATTSSTSLTITGSKSAGAAVRIGISNSAIAGAVSYPSTTTWQIPVSNLQQGANGFTLTASSGGTDYDSKTVSVTLIVSQPPSPTGPSISIDAVAAFINTTSYTVTGSRDSGSTVAISTDTVAIAGTVTYPSATTWSAPVTGLASGANKITATATNLSATSSATITLNVDNTPPLLQLSMLPDKCSAATPIQNILGMVDETNLDKILINSSQALLFGNQFCSTLKLRGGANEVIITAYDKAGNSTVNSRTVVYQTAKPAFSISYPSDGMNTKKPILTVTGTADVGNTVTINGAPAETIGSNWLSAVPLTSGLNTIIIEAKDLIGNSSSLKVSVIANPNAPELSIDSPAQDLASNASLISLSGKADEGATLTCSINGDACPAILINKGSYAVPIPLGSEATYAVEITATDTYGAISHAVRHIVADKTPPNLTIDNLSASAPNTIKGTTESGSIVSAIHDTTILKSMVSTDGKWSFDLTGSGHPRTSIVIRASDAAGNTTSLSQYPRGDMDDSGGEPDISDAVKLLRIALGEELCTVEDLERGDIAPLKDGKPDPNNVIDANDVILLLNRLLGLESW